MANKIKSGASTPDISYTVCRTPIPTDLVVWHIDDPVSRQAWLEVTSKLLRECERLVALDESPNKTSPDTNEKDVDVLLREKE